MSGFVVKSAIVSNGRIRYTAENDEGESITGVLTQRAAGRNTLITQQGMEKLSQEMIGMELDTSDVDLTRSELDGYSIAGDFDGES